MSTRCVINFGTDGEVEAKIYRHSDGYPDGVLPDLQEFFAEVERQTSDTRFNDPCYLAAKFVAWQSRQYALTQAQATVMRQNKLQDWPAANHGSVQRYLTEHYLDFLSVGVMMENPGDIEYEYFVDCDSRGSDGRPEVTYKAA